MKEKILCSAIWYKDLPTQQYLPKNCDMGVVVCGWRHASIIATTMALSGLRTTAGGTNAAGETVQGFLTNTNRFVDRAEAGDIAFNCGQTTEHKRHLFSEDVW